MERTSHAPCKILGKISLRSEKRSRATQNLVARIHQASGIAKIVHGQARERLYGIKKELVIYLEMKLPGSVFIDSIQEWADGTFLFSLHGPALGRLHLLARTEAEFEGISATLSLAPRMT